MGSVRVLGKQLVPALRRQAEVIVGHDRAGEIEQLLALGQDVPQPGGAVDRGRHHLPPIGPERHVLDAAAVAHEHGERRPGGRIPEPDRAVPIGGGGNAPAIGAEGGGVDALGVAAQDGELATARRVPDAPRVIHAAAQHPAAVGAEQRARDEALVRVQGLQRRAGRAVPDAHLAVTRAGDDAQRMRRVPGRQAEGRVGHDRAMGHAPADLRTRAGIPEPGFGVVGDGQQPGAVGAEDRAPHRAAMGQHARRADRHALRDRPEPRRAVGRGGRDLPAIGAELGIEHEALVAGQRSAGRQPRSHARRRLLAERGQIPEQGLAAGAGGHQIGAVRAEGGMVDVAAMALQDGQLGARARVPEARQIVARPDRAGHGLLLRRGHEPALVGAELDVADRTARAPQHQRLPARLRIPELDQAVLGAGHQPAAVGAEPRPERGGRVLAGKGDLRAGPGVPQAHRAVARGRDHGAAVGAERGLHDRAVVSLQDRERPPDQRVPEAGGAILRRGHHEPAAVLRHRVEFGIEQAVLMARHGLADRRAGGRVPQPRGRIVRSREHVTAVGTEDRPPDGALVRAQRPAKRVPRRHAPEPRRAVRGSGHHPIARGREGDIDHAARVAGQGCDRRAAGRIEDPRRAVPRRGRDVAGPGAVIGRDHRVPMA